MIPNRQQLQQQRRNDDHQKEELETLEILERNDELTTEQSRLYLR